MGLGVGDLCFPYSINGVHVPQRLYALSVLEAAAVLMKISNSGAAEIAGNRTRKRSQATKKPRIVKTEPPFGLEMPMFMKDRIKMIGNCSGDDRERNRKRERSPSPATKKQRMIKKTEPPPFIPETPTRMISSGGDNSGVDDDRERNANGMMGPPPPRKRKTEPPRLIPDTPTMGPPLARKRKTEPPPLIPDTPTMGPPPARRRKTEPPPIPEIPAPARKPRSKKKTEPPSVSEMPAAMRNQIEQMGGSNFALVIEKELADTDLNKNHGRLSLPPKMVRTEFLTEEEKNMLGENEGKKKKGMKVVIMENDLEEKSLSLKKWKIGSEDAYCLMTDWNSFVKKRGLKAGDLIQLWSFRRDYFDSEQDAIVAMLCFALVRLDV